MDNATENSGIQRVKLALENAGQYLHKDGLGHLSRDLTGLVRQNPIPALLCGLALGFVVGHTGSGVRGPSHD